MSTAAAGERTSIDGPPGATGAEGRAALGRALKARAGEIAHAVLASWHRRSPAAAEAAGADVEADILRTTESSARQVAHYLVTGEVQTEQQAQTLAATGKAPLRDTIALAELTKLYLYWRETTISVLTEDATVLGLGARTLTEALAAVRTASDSSIVRMTKQFDAERRRLEAELGDERARLAHHTFHDALTDLPNRRLFFDRLSHALDLVARHGTGVALLYVDVDDFKAINDRHGHLAGDEMLVAIARRLGTCVRATDTVARLGGDEFVVLSEQLADPARDAVSLAERIRAALAEPLGVVGLQVCASIGIAVTTSGADADTLLRRADDAMYVAKRRGCGRYELANATA
jgi:diguanylate cyclase (GGDEF)-like protein